MLVTIAVILAILWLAGFSLQIGGNMVHLILVIAAIVLIYNFVVGRRAV